MSDPVHYVCFGQNDDDENDNYSGPGWYFWAETWADRYGPYETEELCRAKLKEYCTEVLGI